MGRPIATDARAVGQALGWDVSAFGRLLLRHPAAWRSVPSDEGPHESGPSQRVGYLTDQVALTPECSTSGAETTCEPAVRRLQPGGIVVTISVSALEPLPLTTTTTVAGRPAELTRTDDAACADAGGDQTDALDVRIRLGASSGASVGPIIEIDVCLAHPISPGSRRSVTRMLTTATLS